MESPDETEQGAAQDAQYRFPYHYLPRIENGGFRMHAVLDWGHEYLAYMTHVAGLAAARPWSSLLDVGCGDGRLVAMLAARFPERRCVGLDYSERAVALASALAPEGRFVRGDVTDPALFPEPFDGATCVDTLEHVDPAALPAFVKGIRDQLRPGAFLIATVPSANVPLTRKHFQHFTEEGLRAALEGPFAVERIGFLNGGGRRLALLRRLIANRFYLLAEPRLTGLFYRHYVKRHLISDARRCRRLVALCRAA